MSLFHKVQDRRSACPPLVPSCESVLPKGSLRRPEARPTEIESWLPSRFGRWLHKLVSPRFHPRRASGHSAPRLPEKFPPTPIVWASSRRDGGRPAQSADY